MAINMITSLSHIFTIQSDIKQDGTAHGNRRNCSQDQYDFMKRSRHQRHMSIPIIPSQKMPSREMKHVAGDIFGNLSSAVDSVTTPEGVNSFTEADK